MAERQYPLGNKAKDLLVYTFIVTKPVGDRTVSVDETIKTARAVAVTEAAQERSELVNRFACATEKKRRQGYPKSAVHTYVRTMRETSINILKNVQAANDCGPHELPQRISIITEVIRDCGLLLNLIEISHTLGYINMKRMTYWTKLTTDVKYMSMAWKKNEEKRAGGER